MKALCVFEMARVTYTKRHKITVSFQTTVIVLIKCVFNVFSFIETVSPALSIALKAKCMFKKWRGIVFFCSNNRKKAIESFL